MCPSLKRRQLLLSFTSECRKAIYCTAAKKSCLTQPPLLCSSSLYRRRSRSSLETFSLFTIFVFWNHRLHLKRTCFLLINLAAADLLVGISESIILGTEKIPTVKEAKREGKTTGNPSSALLVLGSSTSVFFLPCCGHFVTV